MLSQRGFVRSYSSVARLGCTRSKDDLDQVHIPTNTSVTLALSHDKYSVNYETTQLRMSGPIQCP